MEDFNSTAAARPYWIPATIDPELLPAELRAAIDELINPLYDELVIRATDPLERATGSTITHLMWLELIEQVELASQGLQPKATPERAKAIGRHLRVIGAKTKVSSFLLRLRAYREKRDLFGLDLDSIRRAFEAISNQT